MDKPRVLLVLDGAAESSAGRPFTTLSSVRPPFLSALARTMKVGLFDPRDPTTGTVRTEQIVAAISGVSLTPWPGKAWLEAASEMSSGRISYASIVRAVDSLGRRCPLGPQVTIELNHLELHGGIAVQRLHERMASSWLLAFSAPMPPDAAAGALSEMNEIVGRICGGTVRMTVGDVFVGRSPPVITSRLDSTLLAHASGALLGLCAAAGIHAWRRPGSPLDMPLHTSLFAEIRKAIDSASFCNFILYVKAMDWASHDGDGVRKAEWLSFVDAELLSFLHERRKELHITIVSDHRTDIGSDEASHDHSVFATSAQEADDCVMVETDIEANWNRPALSLVDLSWLAFPT